MSPTDEPTASGAGAGAAPDAGTRGGPGSLERRYPFVVAEWHPTRNPSPQPSGISAGRREHRWWRCLRCGHEWVATIGSRVAGFGCPRCQPVPQSTRRKDE